MPGRRRTPQRSKCYTELVSAPSTLIHEGQVVRLASHVWRECHYAHISDQDQDRDLSGMLCTTWLQCSGRDASAVAALASSSRLRIHRVWLVNQHNCQVHSSRVVPVHTKMGIVHAWGPREPDTESDSSHNSHSTLQGRGQASGAAGTAPSQLCTAGPQYRALYEGPCWELCTVCDVMALVVDAVSGQELGLLKSEDKVVSAEVVFRWQDLARLAARLVLLTLHLVTIAPMLQLVAQVAGLANALFLFLQAVALRAQLRLMDMKCFQWKQRPWDNDGKAHSLSFVHQHHASHSSAACTQAASSGSSLDTQVRVGEQQSSNGSGVDAVDQPLHALFEPSQQPERQCIEHEISSADSTPPVPSPMASMTSDSDDQSHISPSSPHGTPRQSTAAAPHARGTTVVAGSTVMQGLNLHTHALPASVQLPEWSGHVFACRGTMQSAVFCAAFVTGLLAAVCATGVATLLTDVVARMHMTN